MHVVGRRGRRPMLLMLTMMMIMVINQTMRCCRLWQWILIFILVVTLPMFLVPGRVESQTIVCWGEWKFEIRYCYAFVKMGKIPVISLLLLRLLVCCEISSLWVSSLTMTLLLWIWLGPWALGCWCARADDDDGPPPTAPVLRTLTFLMTQPRGNSN